MPCAYPTLRVLIFRAPIPTAFSKQNLSGSQVSVGGDFLVKVAEILGQNLKAIRKTNGIRQEEIAQKLNITASAVSRWEHGLSLPDAVSLDELCSYLGIPAWKLFYSELPVSELQARSTQPKCEPSLAEAIRVVNAHILGDIVIKRKRSHK